MVHANDMNKLDGCGSVVGMLSSIDHVSKGNGFIQSLGTEKLGDGREGVVVGMSLSIDHVVKGNLSLPSSAANKQGDGRDEEVEMSLSIEHVATGNSVSLTRTVSSRL
jgi:hypothetical protein